MAFGGGSDRMMDQVRCAPASTCWLCGSASADRLAT